MVVVVVVGARVYHEPIMLMRKEAVRGKKHFRALEDQKALSPESWKCHVSHGKDLSKWVECQGRSLKIISGDSLGSDSVKTHRPCSQES